jgi:hypothetical protein
MEEIEKVVADERTFIPPPHVVGYFISGPCAEGWLIVSARPSITGQNGHS